MRVRDVIRDLPTSRIAEVSALGFGDPAVIPLWYGEGDLPTRLLPNVWHVHEMVFGFAAATVAGFLLTAIPNWTSRMPLQGAPLAVLVLLWAAGRVAVAVGSAGVQAARRGTATTPPAMPPATRRNLRRLNSIVS